MATQALHYRSEQRSRGSIYWPLGHPPQWAATTPRLCPLRVTNLSDGSLKPSWENGACHSWQHPKQLETRAIRYAWLRYPWCYLASWRFCGPSSEAKRRPLPTRQADRPMQGLVWTSSPLTSPLLGGAKNARILFLRPNDPKTMRFLASSASWRLALGCEPGKLVTPPSPRSSRRFR